MDPEVWHRITQYLSIASVGKLICSSKSFSFLSHLCKESRLIHELSKLDPFRFQMISYLRINNYSADSDTVDKCLEVWNRIAQHKASIERREDGNHIFLQENLPGLHQITTDLLSRELWIVCYYVPPDGETRADSIFSLANVATVEAARTQFLTIW